MRVATCSRRRSCHHLALCLLKAAAVTVLQARAVRARAALQSMRLPPCRSPADDLWPVPQTCTILVNNVHQVTSRRACLLQVCQRLLERAKVLGGEPQVTQLEVCLGPEALVVLALVGLQRQLVEALQHVGLLAAADELEQAAQLLLGRVLGDRARGGIAQHGPARCARGELHNQPGLMSWQETSGRFPMFQKNALWVLSASSNATSAMTGYKSGHVTQQLAWMDAG